MAGITLLALFMNGSKSNYSVFSDTERGFRFLYPIDYVSENTQQEIFIIHPAGGELPVKVSIDVEVGDYAREYFYNSNAQTLDDYLADYSNGDVKVLVQSSDEFFVNGHRVLKQAYKIGVINHPSGELDFGSLGSVDNGIRYVFWNGKERFLILSTSIEGLKGVSETERVLDQIAGSFEWI